MVVFSQQTIDQPDGFHHFTVINGPDSDAGLPLELLQNRLGIDLVLGGVNNDLRGRCERPCQPSHRRQQRSGDNRNHRNDKPPPMANDFTPRELVVAPTVVHFLAVASHTGIFHPQAVRL